MSLRWSSRASRPSLDELADTAEFRGWVAQAFPPSVLARLDELNRRDFLKLMAASFALAGLVGCRQSEDIVPYLRPVEGMIAGKPLFFASAVTRGGYSTGVVVESHEGRPTKIEGNPDHPASLGATDVFTQAEILTLYDPDRSQTVMRGDDISTWDLFERALDAELARVRAQQGRGLCLLTGAVTSPTLVAQLEALRNALPQARWYVHEPVSMENIPAGTRLAFGQAADLVYRFDRADVILALDSDCLFALPGSVRYARDFANRRAAAIAPGSGAAMNRLYVVEPAPTITGARADHRLSLRRSQIEPFVRALAAELGLAWLAGEAAPAGGREWMQAAARDLAQHRGASVVLAGPAQPPTVQALVCALNDALGNLGQTVLPIAPVAAGPGDQPRSLVALANDIDAGDVDALVIIDTNPAYDAPVDLQFAERLRRIGFSVHLGLYRDETALGCQWHLPLTHALESWSDARAFDGTASIIQPLIAPLYRGRTVHELLAILHGDGLTPTREIVRRYWQSRVVASDFERWWSEVLRMGVVPDSQAPPLSVSIDRAGLGAARGAATRPASAPSGALELVFQPDATVWDGRYANNGWLQELPEPISKLTWDNAALVSPATAARAGLATGDVVELSCRGQAAHAPVWVNRGQADDCVVIALGYGRTAAGQVGSGIGFNAYALRHSDAPWLAAGLVVQKINGRYGLVTPQGSSSMEGRAPVRYGTSEQFRRAPESLVAEGPPTPSRSLYPRWPYPGQQWGMAIDLTRCIGCNACIVACQAENNIAVVGKDQVRRGRIMYWIRVDRYLVGDASAPAFHYQPLPCMHCECAPCELVCPVGATQHSHDGLNEMIYNRCVGTRYCSNNCPYKVRRFNFYRWTDYAPSLTLQRNPEVSVRARGVMEKCTYCVQRIRAADIAALKENRKIRDGEVRTACQQVCPTGAIVFGDINDPESRIAKLRQQPLNYALLAELNTRPRTRYLADVRNPNPALV
jgi:MoCo/4Fe-4S cofactor protein with predicted Tat translocation signal